MSTETSPDTGGPPTSGDVAPDDVAPDDVEPAGPIATDLAAVPRSRLSWRDLFGEALAGVLARPARAAMTTLGTVLGVAKLVQLRVENSRGCEFGGDAFELSADEVSLTDLTFAGPTHHSAAIRYDINET